MRQWMHNLRRGAWTTTRYVDISPVSSLSCRACRSFIECFSSHAAHPQYISTTDGKHGRKLPKNGQDVQLLQQLSEQLRRKRGTTVEDKEEVIRRCELVMDDSFSKTSTAPASRLAFSLGAIEDAIRCLEEINEIPAETHSQSQNQENKTVRRQLLKKLVKHFVLIRQTRKWFRRNDSKATQQKKAVTSLIRCLVCPVSTNANKLSQGSAISPSEVAETLPDMFSPNGKTLEGYDREYMQPTLTVIAAYQEALITNAALNMRHQYPDMNGHEHCYSVSDLWEDKLLSWCLCGLSSYGMFATAFLLLQHCIHGLPASLLCSIQRPVRGTGYQLKFFASSCTIDMGISLHSLDEESVDRAKLLNSQQNVLHDQIRTSVRTKDSDSPFATAVNPATRQLWEQGELSKFCNEAVRLPQATSTLLLEQFSVPSQIPFAWQLYCNSSPAAVLQGFKWYASKSRRTSEALTLEEDSPLFTRDTVPDGGFQHHIFVASATLQSFLSWKKLDEAMWIYRQQRGNLHHDAGEHLVHGLAANGALEDVFRVLGDYIRAGSCLPSELVRRVIVASLETVNDNDGWSSMISEEQSAMQLLSRSEGERYPWVCEDNLEGMKEWVRKKTSKERDKCERSTETKENAVDNSEGERNKLKSTKTGSLEATRHMLSNLDKSALANKPLGSLGISRSLLQFAAELGQATGEWSESQRLLRNLSFNSIKQDDLRELYTYLLRSIGGCKQRELFHRILREKVLFDARVTHCSFETALKEAGLEIGCNIYPNKDVELIDVRDFGGDR